MYICELLECIQNTSGISPPDAPASRSVQYESHSLTCTSTLMPVSSVKRSHICCRPFCWLLSQITTSSESLLPLLLPSPFPPHAQSENAVAAASPTATVFFNVLLIKPSSFLHHRQDLRHPHSLSYPEFCVLFCRFALRRSVCFL